MQITFLCKRDNVCIMHCICGLAYSSPIPVSFIFSYRACYEYYIHNTRCHLRMLTHIKAVVNITFQHSSSGTIYTVQSPIAGINNTYPNNTVCYYVMRRLVSVQEYFLYNSMHVKNLCVTQLSTLFSKRNSSNS